MSGEEIEFDLRELSLYEGNGRLPYVAYQSVVYDLSESFLWQKGKHQGLHRSGKALPPKWKMPRTGGFPAAVPSGREIQAGKDNGA